MPRYTGSFPQMFLTHESGATSVTDAAYRLVRHEPSVGVVLFGAGDKQPLRANIASILAPALLRGRLAADVGATRPRITPSLAGNGLPAYAAASHFQIAPRFSGRSRVQCATHSRYLRGM